MTVLALPGDSQEEILEKIVAVTAFLEEAFSGDHVHSESQFAFSAEASAGLAYICQDLNEAARAACEVSTKN